MGECFAIKSKKANWKLLFLSSACSAESWSQFSALKEILPQSQQGMQLPMVLLGKTCRKNGTLFVLAGLQGDGFCLPSKRFIKKLVHVLFGGFVLLLKCSEFLQRFYILSLFGV